MKIQWQVNLNEKRRDALKRLLASQEQQVVLHMLKVVGRHTKNFEDQGFIGFCYTLQALTLHKPNVGINDGFGREAMELAIS